MQAVRASRVEIHLLQDQNVSIHADEEVGLSGRWFRYGSFNRPVCAAAPEPKLEKVMGAAGSEGAQECSGQEPLKFVLDASLTISAR